MSTAVAIEWALAPASVPKKFALLATLRSLRTQVLARLFRAQHRDLTRAIEAAVDEIASAVLAAQDRAELELALDEQTTAYSLVRVIEGLSNLHSSSTLRRLAKEKPSATDWEWLGAAAARHMELGGFYANQVALTVTDAVEKRGRAFVEAFGNKPGEDLLAFLTHRDVHVDVADALLAMYRSIVSILAIGGSRRLGVSLKPWLALDLAERFAHGQRQQLRLLASVPGFSVPEDVVPASERFDLAKLTAEARAADERLRTMTIDPSAYVE